MEKYEFTLAEERFRFWEQSMNYDELWRWRRGEVAKYRLGERIKCIAMGNGLGPWIYGRVTRIGNGFIEFEMEGGGMMAVIPGSASWLGRA